MQAFPLQIHGPLCQMDELLLTLLKFHATAEQIYMASQTWNRPLTSVTATRKLIQKAKQKGYITSQPTLSTTIGNPPHFNYLRKQAGIRSETIRDIANNAPTSSIFNPYSEGELRHALGCSHFASILHRSIGVTEGIKLEVFLRDHQFKTLVKIRRNDGTTTEELLDPDGFVILSIAGSDKLYPFFLECQRRSCRRLSVTKRNLLKRWQRRLTLYKVFHQNFNKHPLVKHYETLLGKKLEPFQTLVFSYERTNMYLDNLRAADFSKSSIFGFARLEALLQKNVLTNKCWRFSNGERFALFKTS